MIDLGSLQALAHRHWRPAAYATAAATVAVATGMYLFPFKYNATATLLIAPPQHVVKAEEVVSPVGQDTGSLESQVQIMLSNGFLRDVVRDLRLDADPVFLSKISSRAAAAPQDERLQALAEVFKDTLKVARRGLTYVIDVDYASRNASDAARFANAVAQHFVDDQRKQREDAAQQASNWLGERIAKMRQKVIDSEKAAADFRTANGMIDAGAGNTVIDRQLTDLTQQLGIARSRLADAKARFDELQNARLRGETLTLSDSLQSPAIVNLRSQYVAASRNVADLTATLGERHPQILAARAELADLRQQIENELGRIRNSASNDLTVAQSKERALSATFTKLQKAATSTDEASVRLRELEREAKANDDLYEEYLTRQKETADQQDLFNNDTRIVSMAVPPPTSARPKTPILIGASLVVGLLAGLLTIVARETRDRMLLTPDQIRAGVGLPCLGFAPSLGEGAVDPNSPELRDAIRAMQGVVNNAKVTLIAPALSQTEEAASRLGWQLAKALTRNGMKTLFVDFEPDGSMLSGLADVLYRHERIEDVIRSRPNRPAVLSVGALSPGLDVAEMLVHPHVGEAVNSLRRRYDAILIGAPAAGPALQGLMEISDAAILVVDAQAANRATIAAAARTLREQADVPIFTLINRTDPPTERPAESRIARIVKMASRKPPAEPAREPRRAPDMKARRARR